MGASPSAAYLNRRRRALEKKYGEPFMILRASNGEACIVSRSYYLSCQPKPSPVRRSEWLG